MKGTEEFINRFDSMSKNRISKADAKWMLTGFYNSLLINKSYTTAYLYLGFIINFLKNIDDIRAITVDDYYGYLVSLKSKSSTVQIDAYHALQKYSKYLKSKGICEDHMVFVERPKFVETQETKDKRERGYLTKDQVKNLFNKVEMEDISDCWKQRDKVILMIFLTTGIRCSALYKLDVADVDLENKTISVLEKGSKYKKVNISDKTTAAIKEWLEYRNKLLGGVRENALIISNRKNRMDTATIHYTIKKYGNVGPHKLRSTYGTNLYMETGDVYFVQECMNHSNPKTTELYIRGQKGDNSKRAAKLMDDFLE